MGTVAAKGHDGRFLAPLRFYPLLRPGGSDLFGPALGLSAGFKFGLTLGLPLLMPYSYTHQYKIPLCGS
jgi:hypothetical protein